MIHILLVDDHQIVLDGLVSYLQNEDDFCVVGHAMSGREAVELALELRPAVVVMDIAMPDLNGIEATRQIKAQLPESRIIGLSTHTESRFVAEMMSVGASGYLPKKCAARELVSAIRATMLGQTFLSPSVTGEVMNDYLNNRESGAATGLSRLSGREREVLQLVAEGVTMKEIAHDLEISLKTAHTHRQRTMEKLDLHSVAELTKFAVREDLTSL